ncbi:hypothetical protein IPJ72_03070 [Candidatus Peregrinibacteria bacterium]|nr:MAG: hypothetical protein IPJ72_03070 [Candidatus Peregrinibacteria bacterium]
MKYFKKPQLIVGLIVIAIPFILIYFTKNSNFEWIARLISINIFIFLIPAIFLYVLINPKTIILKKYGSKSRESEIKKVKKIEKVIRIIGIGLVIMFLYQVSSKIANDELNLRQSIISEEGWVTTIESPNLGGIFLYQRFRLNGEKNANNNFRLLYPLGFIKYQKYYRIRYLKNSRFVLDYQMMNEPSKP